MAKVYTEPAAQSHEQGGHDEAEQHHSSTKLYWIIGVILAVVTVLEVFWPSMGFNHYGVLGGLLIMMLFKGAMVVMFFMHLKGDPNIFKFIFIFPLFIAVSFVLSMIALLSVHVGIAG